MAADGDAGGTETEDEAGRETEASETVGGETEDCGDETAESAEEEIFPQDVIKIIVNTSAMQIHLLRIAYLLNA